MNVSPKSSSQWIAEFERQLFRGNHALLYGNVHDLCLVNGEFLPLTELSPMYPVSQGFLGQYFMSAGYEVVVFWDMLDGLQFVNSEMRGPFESVLRRCDPGQSPAANASPSHRRAEGRDSVTPHAADSRQRPSTVCVESSANAGHEQQAGRRLPLDAARDSRGPDNQCSAQRQPGDDQYRDPASALQAFRTILRQRETPTAVVLSFSDCLLSDPERQDQVERQVLIQLQKTMQEAAQLTDGPLANRRNTLILVTEKLHAFPDWLYRDNPHLKLVHVSKPQRSERLAFVTRYKDSFCGGASLDGSDRDAAFRQFADVTEGLKIWDLTQIAMASHTDSMHLGDAKKLVNFYRFGEKRDPWADLDSEKVETACDALGRKVFGQPEAVKKMVDLLVSARVGLSMVEEGPRGGKPKGIFFFVGPTGVGKTQLAKEIASLIFGDQSSYARFDMSEYAQEHAAERLAGSPPGYVGYEQGGQLTNRMLQRPFSVLLFDEIKKAHGKVLDKFLQILEDGRLTDSKGQTAYFDQSVIIFTSNIGSGCLKQGKGVATVTDTDPSYEELVLRYRGAVKQYFEDELQRPELLNRIGEENIVVFDVLRPNTVELIAGKFLKTLSQSAKDTCALELEFHGSVIKLIQRLMSVGDNLLFGGRRILKLLEEQVQVPVSHWIFMRSPAEGSWITVAADLEAGAITVNGEQVC